MLPGELHTLQSVSKVIAGAIIAQLENEKKIDLTNPVETYLPELKKTALIPLLIQKTCITNLKLHWMLYPEQIVPPLQYINILLTFKEHGHPEKRYNTILLIHLY